jgi:AcrR family transcriptional regulator
MMRKEKPNRRRYRAPAREAAAARTRVAIVTAARDSFEQRGWAGTTMAGIAAVAGVSQKTVEAVFGTKAVLLQAAVDYAVRGDVEPVPIVRRDAVKRMESVADAAGFLRLHAAHLRAINERSARIAWTVEHAAGSDSAVAALWARMNGNRAFGVRWAASTLLAKTGRRRGLRRRDVEASFWVAFDWSTYRTLTQHAGLDADGFERWLRWWYAATFLETR